MTSGLQHIELDLFHILYCLHSLSLKSSPFRGVSEDHLGMSWSSFREHVPLIISGSVVFLLGQVNKYHTTPTKQQKSGQNHRLHPPGNCSIFSNQIQHLSMN